MSKASASAHRERTNTENEIDYIDGLGRWRKGDRRKSREKCLTGYRAAFYLRENWGLVDKKQILAHLNEALGQEGLPALPALEDDHPAILFFRLQNIYKKIRELKGR